MSNRALLVIDIQNDYFPGGNWPLVGIDEAAANAARLIMVARDLGDLVVHVRHEFPTADAPFFVPNSKGAQTHPNVTPNEGEPVILKNHVNAFRETELKTLLDGNGIEQLVICGAMSHMCIDAATRAANDYGYSVTLIHDACASRDVEFNGVVVPAAHVHAAFMAALQFAYAQTISTDEFIRANAVKLA